MFNKYMCRKIVMTCLKEVQHIRGHSGKTFITFRVRKSKFILLNKKSITNKCMVLKLNHTKTKLLNGSNQFVRLIHFI
jgi:hypothetical protein